MSTTTIGTGRVSTATGLDTVLDRANAAQAVIQRFLARAGVPALRVSLGLVFLVFGALKFLPGVSPVEDLVTRTWNALSFGLVDGYAAMALTAGLEVFVGLTLVTGVLLRVGLLALAATFVGIFSPLVFFAGELFSVAGPTLTAQYILKDVVLVAAAMVVAAAALRRPIGRRR
ncbi:DoxX family membrane protein [Agromyces aerolatus]|uniref:DoxX family membrane protein n=1 Tax=Agromyces sp. LY-1074 TaxID=3074080 RepID=UPI00285728CA|nr:MULTISPECIES: DoxX family membrane protein [unclassified Agromyces]MDR5700625.1 DoxX family protein [Agromyces sp. LY-1074]MDR5707146.1 DoxX family protein [Agromyces sp. LY-1358]